MTTTEWLTIIALLGAVVGYLEFRIGRQDDARHALRTEIQILVGKVENEQSDQGKLVAKLWNKAFGNGQH